MNSQVEPEDEPIDIVSSNPEIIFEEELPADVGKLVEVVYRWKEPQSSVDEIVYKRLIKVQRERLGCYYYSMYARCKDNILTGKTSLSDAWTPERVLIGGKNASVAAYKGVIERGESQNFRIIYYQQTPFGLLRLGETRRLSDEFVADIKFVRCIASEVGKDTPPTLWHIGALVSGSLALFDYFNPKKEEKNHSPVADFRAIPMTGTINTNFYFDASISTDADEPDSTGLLVRWDLDGDSNWDNAFTFDKITTTSFAGVGSHTIGVQVRDRAGAFSTVTKTVTTIAVGPGLGATPHPMFRNTITHTGVSVYNGPVVTTTKWTYTTGEIIEASPSVASDGTIYVGSYDGVLYALSPTSGSTLWTSPLGPGVVHSSVAIASDGTIYAGAGNNLYAINPANGNQYWSYNTGGLVRSSPVIDSDGTVYIGSMNGSLYAVNPDGSFKWSFTTGGQIWSSPAIGPDGTVYVGSLDNKLYAVNQNSTLKWSYTTGGGIYSSPAVDNSGVVYVGSWDGSFYAINSNGTLKWSVPTGGQVWSSPALDSAKVLFGSDDDKLYCRNASDGTPLWIYTAGNNIRSSPTVDASGRVYFGADDGKLYGLTSAGADLSADWPIDLSGATATIRSSVAIAANAVTPTLYVGSNDRKIYAIGAATLDPADLTIQKYANKAQVSIGEVVTYKVVITNRGVDPTSATATTVIDSIPAGFKYLKGSSRLSGAVQADPIGSDTLTFDVGHFTPGLSKTLTYQLIVGSGLAPGKYTNRAYARYYYDKPPITEGVTAIAKSEVWVVPDPLFDLGTIIGKVFWDKNANGIQDQDEGGYGVAQIIMEDGTIITTDKNGGYHIPGVKPGTHLLHLKDVSEYWITTDSPCLARVTPGLLVKANFGIKPADKPMSSFVPPLNDLTFVLLGEAQVDSVSTNGRDASKQDKNVKDGNRLNGRLAYYLSGKIENKFEIASSLDTKRSTLNAPQATFFRHIDPDKYYTEYGDNSAVSFDAANTAGPFYLRIDSLPEANLGKSSLLYGSYNSGINKTEPEGTASSELATYHRTLAGVKLDAAQVPVYKNDRLAIKASGTVFASSQDAQTEQVPAHNEFRATGGSVYYLKNKDILHGSERIALETRDQLTNLALVARQLARDSDYEIDYSNGRIIFRQPPAMVDSSTHITSNNILGGNPVYVVVDYEYAPAGSRGFNDGPYGGRLSGELSDNRNNRMQLGGTYIAEADDSDYELKGVDFSLDEAATFIIPMRLSLSAEYAESTSRSMDGYISANGGLGFNTVAGTNNSQGVANKIKVGIKPAEWLNFDSYYQKVEPGFISSSSYNYQGSMRYGYLIKYSATENLKINLRYDNQELLKNANIVSQGNIGADRTETGALQGVYRKDQWTITNEYRYQESTNLVGGVAAETNQDLTLGALKVDYAFSQKSNLYAIQQSTLKGDTNSQTTLGAAFPFSEKTAVNLQATNGTKGQAYLIGVNNKVSDKTETFSNVSISDDGASDTLQTSNGATHQLTPDTRLNAQQDYATKNTRATDATQRSTATVLGQETRLSDKWQFWASAQQGTVNDYNGTTNIETIRESGSLRFRYADRDKTAFDTKLEARFDEGDVDKHQYLTANSFRHQLTPDITVSLRENYSWTENRTTDKTEALFKETGLGLALRPIKWDKWHLLAKYTYLKDIYPAAQAGVADIAPTRTRSDIYALETAYDLSKTLQLVEKYAFKDMKETISGYDETDNQVALWINRINYNVFKQWYAGVEHRILRQTLGQDKKSGFLAEVMHKANRNVHLGVGYNFTDFSDDLRRNNDYSANGFFFRINAIIEY
ncbi:MAG: PQQ-binding-like beta-propeller repeat protein [Planctomycetes bacterium]|nr:PQQ-binding-like beta-propeller repeat protein [Planctomycetota bacterium]